MSTTALGAFLAQAGALLAAMLFARSYALRRVPQCYLPSWVRVRELRRDAVCRRVTVPAVTATLVGVVLILIG